MKNIFGIALFALFLAPSVFGADSVAYRKTPLIPELEAQRYGLTRAWFNQATINTKKNQLVQMVLQDGTLYLVSDDARLHVVDAETGATLWVREIGDPSLVCVAPAANSRMVATLCGNTLTIFDRRNGNLLWQKEHVPGVPVAGVELGERYVFVPTTIGRVHAWPLEIEERDIDSLKRAEVEPEKEPAPKDEHDRVLAEIRYAVESARKSLDETVETVSEKPLRLKPPGLIPLECQSFGSLLVQPTLTTKSYTGESIVWPSNRGELFSARIGIGERYLFNLRYQFRIVPQSYSFSSNRDVQSQWRQPRAVIARASFRPPMIVRPDGAVEAVILPTIEDEDLKNLLDFEILPDQAEAPKPGSARPGQMPPLEAGEIFYPNMVVAGSLAGAVVALDEENGTVFWKYIASEPITESVALIRDRIYFCLEDGGMYCLGAEKGKERWFTPNITQFIAESKKYVYARNTLKELVILDRQNGNIVSSFSILPFDFFLFNLESDRIFLGTRLGLVQCLHERDLAEPLKHHPSSADFAQLLDRSWTSSKKKSPSGQESAPAQTTRSPFDEDTKKSGDTDEDFQSPFRDEGSRKPASEDELGDDFEDAPIF